MVTTESFAQENDDPRADVVILTGYLGSGKTTLLNRLLRDPLMADAAVIVNEFGDVGIDHALVEASTDGVVLLSSGCLCCTVRSDLLATLSELAAKKRASTIPPFRRVVIETTGLADPAPILQALAGDYAALSEYRVGRVIAVVDALNGWSALDERFEAVRQVALADRLVISKTDLVPADAVERLRKRLSSLAPMAEQFLAVRGDIDCEPLIMGEAFDLSGRSDEARRWLQQQSDPALGSVGHDTTAHAHHDEHIRAHCLFWDQPLDWTRLAQGLDRVVIDHGSRLLRIKGLANVEGQEAPVVIQGVRRLLHAPYTLSRWPDEDRRTRLVFITEGLERAQIERSIERGGREGVSAEDLWEV